MIIPFLKRRYVSEISFTLSYVSFQSSLEMRNQKENAAVVDVWISFPSSLGMMMIFFVHTTLC